MIKKEDIEQLTSEFKKNFLTKDEWKQDFNELLSFIGDLASKFEKDSIKQWSEIRMLRKESNVLQAYKTLTDDHEKRISRIEGQIIRESI